MFEFLSEQENSNIKDLDSIANYEDLFIAINKMDLSFEKKELIIRKFMKGNFWNFINTLSNSLPNYRGMFKKRKWI